TASVVLGRRLVISASVGTGAAGGSFGTSFFGWVTGWVLGGSSPSNTPNIHRPAITSNTRATTPTTPLMIKMGALVVDFGFGAAVSSMRSSSSPRRRRAPAVLTAGPVAVPRWPLARALVVTVASAGSSAAPFPAGSSTTKRYLHLGQSILRPMRLGSRTGTIASQLGHCCLKLVLVAINATPRHLAKVGKAWVDTPPDWLYVS